jgi:peptidyl-prolyl cis-trans isomerase C
VTKAEAVRAAGAKGAGWLRGRSLLVPRPRKARVVGVLVLVLLSAGSGTQIAVDRITALPADAAFRIGGTVFTQSELDGRAQALEALYGVQRPQDPAGQDRFNRDMAKAVAVSQILQRVAQAKGVVIADKAAQDQLDKLIAASYPAGRDEFIAKLGTVGLSQAEVIDEIKRQMVNAALFDQTTKDVRPATQADAQRYYDTHRAQMVDPEKRHLRNIVVASEADARRILTQLTAHQDFATIASTSSLDGSTKDSGGDLGTATRSQLDPQYADAAFRAAPNASFGPVKTTQGWNVGQVLQVTAAVPLSFQQLKDQLTQQLDTQNKLDRWNAWIGQQIRAAGVEYAPRYRPADPDAPPSDLPR